MNRGKLLLIWVGSALILSGCYLNDDIATDQVGAVVNGGRIEECVGPGIYSAMSPFTDFFKDLVEVPVRTLSVEVTDPEVATKDSQLVGISVVVQVRRQSDCEQVKNLLINWSSYVQDEPLMLNVSSLTNEAIKVGTRSFTLEELLNDRNGLASSISESLEVDVGKFSTDVVNVSVKNVALDPKYGSLLQEKAQLTVQIETELRRQDLIKQQAANSQLEEQQRASVLREQLKAEQAQTSVDVEIASREGKVIAARNEVYRLNSQAFELERLRLLQGVLGDKSTLYFVPEGTNLTLLLSQTGTPMVVPQP